MSKTKYMAFPNELSHFYWIECGGIRYCNTSCHDTTGETHVYEHTKDGCREIDASPTLTGERSVCIA